MSERDNLILGIDAYYTASQFVDLLDAYLNARDEAKAPIERSLIASNLMKRLKESECKLDIVTEQRGALQSALQEVWDMLQSSLQEVWNMPYNGSCLMWSNDVRKRMLKVVEKALHSPLKANRACSCSARHIKGCPYGV